MRVGSSTTRSPVVSSGSRADDAESRPAPAKAHALLVVGRQGHAPLRAAPAGQDGHRLHLHRTARETSRHPRKSSPTGLGAPAAGQRAPPRGEGDPGDVGDARMGKVAHPSYSPDVTPSDYHLFRPLKHHLKKKFTNYGNLKSNIAAFLESQPPEFFGMGIGDLPNR
ncbi:hypothetical protein Q1695_003248 [Nippostrongylus brasiliensis]|nr:hypothetical protein Q1695_003248 [Nippostrongylus brasiliensis]